MIRSRLATLLLAVAIQFPGALATDALGVTLTQEFRETGEPPATIIEMMFGSAHMHGGIVANGACHGDDEPKVSIRLPAGLSVRQALKSIRKVVPGPMTWQAHGGAVDVSLIAHRPTILDYRIDVFTWQPGEAISVAVDRLFQTPGVQRRITKLGLTPGMTVLFGLQAPPRVGSPPPAPSSPLHLKRVSVFTALNSIELSYPKSSFWLYEERNCGQERTYTVGAK